MAAKRCAEIRLVNGDAFEVEGELEEVERKLSDAARSGSRLAWFETYGSGTPVGINPGAVAVLRQGESSR